VNQVATLQTSLTAALARIDKLEKDFGSIDNTCKTDSSGGLRMLASSPCGPQTSSTVEFAVKHTISLDGIAAGTFNSDPKMVSSFRSTVAVTLGVAEDKIFNIVATSDGRRRLYLEGASRFLASTSCSVSYEVRVESQAALGTMSVKVTEKMTDTAAFTSELKTQMIANNVESVSTDTIAADTTAAPKAGGTKASLAPAPATTSDTKAALAPTPAPATTSDEDPDKDHNGSLSVASRASVEVSLMILLSFWTLLS
jgi:hypothetical protein